MTMPGTPQGSCKGTYALFMLLQEDIEICVGSLGEVALESGEYCYVGSAMNGLEKRLNRHFSNNKKMRWHIDYLTICATDMEAYFSEFPGGVSECSIAKAAISYGFREAVKGFGSSDCRCHSHLFSVPEGGKSLLVSGLRMRGFRQCPRAPESGNPYNVSGSFDSIISAHTAVEGTNESKQRSDFIS